MAGRQRDPRRLGKRSALLDFLRRVVSLSGASSAQPNKARMDSEGNVCTVAGASRIQPESLEAHYQLGRSPHPGGETRRGVEAPGCREARPELSTCAKHARRRSGAAMLRPVPGRRSGGAQHRCLTTTRDGMNAGGMTCHGVRSHGRCRACEVPYRTAGLQLTSVYRQSPPCACRLALQTCKVLGVPSPRT